MLDFYRQPPLPQKGGNYPVSTRPVQPRPSPARVEQISNNPLVKKAFGSLLRQGVASVLPGASKTIGDALSQGGFGRGRVSIQLQPKPASRKATPKYMLDDGMVQKGRGQKKKMMY